VNPGFVMDRLPLTLAAACVRVDHVHVTRIVDANKRRAPLRAKTGAGLTVEEFRAGVAARLLGHRGFAESCALVGLGLGLPLDDIRTTIDPVVADRAGIPPGRVAGLRQSAVGVRGGREIVRLDLEMSDRGARSPRRDRDRRRSAPRRRDPWRHARRSRHRRDDAVGHPAVSLAARAEDDPRSRPGCVKSA
jgi:4-hydroxy-tetrahydrodipicolinate reductase